MLLRVQVAPQRVRNSAGRNTLPPLRRGEPPARTPAPPPHNVVPTAPVLPELAPLPAIADVEAALPTVADIEADSLKLLQALAPFADITAEVVVDVCALVKQLHRAAAIRCLLATMRNAATSSQRSSLTSFDLAQSAPVDPRSSLSSLHASPFGPLLHSPPPAPPAQSREPDLLAFFSPRQPALGTQTGSATARAGGAADELVGGRAAESCRGTPATTAAGDTVSGPAPAALLDTTAFTGAERARLVVENAWAAHFERKRFAAALGQSQAQQQSLR